MRMHPFFFSPPLTTGRGENDQNVGNKSINDGYRDKRALWKMVRNGKSIRKKFWNCERKSFISKAAIIGRAKMPKQPLIKYTSIAIKSHLTYENEKLSLFWITEIVKMTSRNRNTRYFFWNPIKDSTSMVRNPKRLNSRGISNFRERLFRGLRHFNAFYARIFSKSKNEFWFLKKLSRKNICKVLTVFGL